MKTPKPYKNWTKEEKAIYKASKKAKKNAVEDTGKAYNKAVFAFHNLHCTSCNKPKKGKVCECGSKEFICLDCMI